MMGQSTRFECSPVYGVVVMAHRIQIRTEDELKEVIAKLIESGCRYIVGVDEAGRGPIAGPVVAAAVFLPHDFSAPYKLRDSKVIAERERECLYRLLRREALIGIGIASPNEIDRLNIRVATLLAMKRAIGNLAVKPDAVLIDGNCLGELPCKCVWVIDGDAICPQISAASIVAKVVRDKWMRRAHRRYPHYGFDTHKGYATPFHKRMLLEHGPCPIHRLSYAPVRELLLSKLPQSGSQ